MITRKKRPHNTLFENSNYRKDSPKFVTISLRKGLAALKVRAVSSINTYAISIHSAESGIARIIAGIMFATGNSFTFMIEKPVAKSTNPPTD